MSKRSMARALGWTAGIAGGLVVAAVAGLAALLVFGAAPQPKELASVSAPMRHIDFSDLPALQRFKARDGQVLSYRLYPGAGPDVVVLIHGSSGESSGMHALARRLNVAGDTVYVPDLRGHGHDGQPGDLNYIGQLEDDLADLVSVIRPLHQNVNFILAGHSSGGGFVLRIAEEPDANLFNRFVLLSPALSYGAETYRPNVGGWATPFVGRIIALRFLNRLGVHWFNSLPIVAFAVDPHAAVPMDAAYSYRMQANFSAPSGATERLATLRQPLAVLVGSEDELFYADRFAPLIHRVCPGLPVNLIPGVDHMGMVTDPRALAAASTAIGSADNDAACATDRGGATIARAVWSESGSR
jgi:alpha-beta hydrolase superfamily lysophospholipase